MFENFASIMNKSSAKTQKSNILNGLKLPMIGVFLLGSTLMSFAFMMDDNTLRLILFSFALFVYIVVFLVIIGIYLYYYNRSYNENPNQLYSEKYNLEKTAIEKATVIGDSSVGHLKLPQRDYVVIGGLDELPYKPSNLNDDNTALDGEK